MSTAPDLRSARKIADALVKNRLAACVSVLPEVHSTYRWKKKIERSSEVLIVIKTAKSRWKAVRNFVLERHPYELPELIALPVTEVSKKYLDWMVSGL